MDELIEKKETERGRLLSRWIGLLPIEQKDSIAREDYNRTVPDCERCKFRNGLILAYGSPLVKCLVKSDNYERHDAKTCKYYTWEGEK